MSFNSTKKDLEKALKAEGISVVSGKVKRSDKSRAIAVAKTLVKAAVSQGVVRESV